MQPALHFTTLLKVTFGATTVALRSPTTGELGGVMLQASRRGPVAPIILILAGCGASGDSSESFGSAANSARVIAIEDTHASADDPDAVSGQLSRMWADGRPETSSFIKFDLADIGGTVTSATLRLWVRNPSVDGPAVFPCESDWSEDSLTWNSRPSRLGAAIADAGSLSSGTWLELDVTQAVEGGDPVAFELASSHKDGASFSTVQSGDPPELLVEWSDEDDGPSAELLADGRVREDMPDHKFGSDSRLDADGNPRARSYLLFDVKGAESGVESATLRLWVRDPSQDGPAVYPAETDWSESTLTWNSRPARLGGILDDTGAVASGTWVEYDVSSWVTQNGIYALELYTSYGDGTVFDSRETSHPPELVVSATPSTDPDPDPDPDPEPDPDPPTVAVTTVRLAPQTGVSGVERVNFALPLPAGALTDPRKVRVMTGGTEIAAARRGLATYPDGSLRSLQLQVDTDVGGGGELELRIGETATVADPALQSVSTTLTASGDQPRVWALLSPAWLAASNVAGPQLPADASDSTSLAWDELCDYDRYDTAEFLSGSDSKGYWLYDRVTTHYKGYVRHGTLTPLSSAYREAHLYRDGITGTGTSTRIGVPDASSDVKYHYTQGLALHYLLTGDDRFRESAENVAIRTAALWTSPGYNGGSDFWTERHAGFALLGYVWAAIVSDDRAAQFTAEAEDAVDAYLAIQDTYPTFWTDSDRRCFAHTAASHAESYGTWGCSPWMSAILAEGLEGYASLVGGSAAVRARDGIVKLGRMIAHQGLDGSGKPYYWLGVGSEADKSDPYDEHWGESAYVVAMAWHYQGKTESELGQTALDLAAGLANHGSAPHLRSFNWQCRGAVATPFYLK